MMKILRTWIHLRENQRKKSIPLTFIIEQWLFAQYFLVFSRQQQISQEKLFLDHFV